MLERCTTKFHENRIFTWVWQGMGEGGLLFIYLLQKFAAQKRTIKSMANKIKIFIKREGENRDFMDLGKIENKF